jgi:hypothetical protein
MSVFRNEIVETAKARGELLKWKLIGVSALGASGLGLAVPNGGRAYLVLALIPLVCFYVDLVCQHYALRILVIARFLALSASGEQAAYERFVERSRQMGRRRINVFALEDWVLDGSTYILSLLVMLAGFVLPSLGGPAPADGALLAGFMRLGDLERDALIGSGAAGIVLTLIGRLRFARRARMLKELASDPDLIESVKFTSTEADG